MLAERLGVPMDVSFGLLRRYSRNENLRLALVAQALLAGDLSAEHIRNSGGTEPQGS